ncbi:hypothetical protein [uncultured Lacinutrix sp.]|uniref:hypothetical protein n=1 Tax=uncultured Lacinutrix sp. TaxID=574032 RepID=UPI0026172C17|nr:hypothetical protein [uncultured Lacinutrix sp.]
MNWKIKALLQKVLSATKLGDNLNHIPATLNKKYNYNTTLYQTHECIRKFSYCNIDLSLKKTALEIGTGYSLISAIVLSLLGFQKIITIDITKDVRVSTYKKQKEYLDHPEILKLIYSNSIYTKIEVINRINKIKESNTLETLLKLLNIKYIAPYTFEDILKEHKQIDYISSQVVLEHITPKTLNKLFKFTKETISKGQFCVHTINFIDHFTNPGFFQDKTISEFNFLKYSNRFWRFWAGNSIAYTNRLSYIYYIELCKKYNLKVIDFIGENYKLRKELRPELIHQDILNKYDSNVNLEDLTKYQRGTLIISNI